MKEKQRFLESLEQKPSGLAIDKKQPLLHQDIKVIEYALLPLEFWALKQAFIQKNPMSTGEYYNLRMVEEYYQYKQHNLNKKKIDVDISSNHKEWDEFYKLRKEVKKILLGAAADDLRGYEQEMRSKKIKFPSYKKINATLINMQDYGLLASRKEPKSKTNAFWFINPQFLLKYGEQFKKAYLS